MAAELPRHAAHFPEGTRGLLVLALPSQDAGATARLVADLQAGEPLRIHVAAVQAAPTGYASSFLRAVDVRAVLTQAGRDTMASLCAELDALGVPYKAHVQVGPWLERITHLVGELGCARVMLGINPRRPLRDAALRFDRWLIGGALRRQGLDCAAIRGDEARARKKAGLAAGPAANVP